MNGRLFAFAIASLFIAGSSNAAVSTMPVGTIPARSTAPAANKGMAARYIKQAIESLKHGDTTGASSELHMAASYAPPAFQQQLANFSQQVWGLKPAQLHKEKVGIEAQLTTISTSIAASK